MVLKEGFERFQDFDLARDARLRGRLSFDHRHPQGPLVPRHQTLEVLQQQLRAKNKRHMWRQFVSTQNRWPDAFLQVALIHAWVDLPLCCCALLSARRFLPLSQAGAHEIDSVLWLG